jgi:hypothetical protein
MIKLNKNPTLKDKIKKINKNKTNKNNQGTSRA